MFGEALDRRALANIQKLCTAIEAGQHFTSHNKQPHQLYVKEMRHIA